MARPVWIGDIVHFVIENRQCRPGIITDMKYPGASHVHLQVMLDGPIYEDGKPPQRALWIHNSPHSKTIAEGHWHSIQECEYLQKYVREQELPKPLVSDPPQPERKPDEPNSIHPMASEPLPKPLGSLEDYYESQRPNTPIKPLPAEQE